MKQKFHYNILSLFSRNYRLKQQAALEAKAWEELGYHYRQLWRRHIVCLPAYNAAYVAVSKAANSTMRKALRLTEKEFSASKSGPPLKRTVYQQKITLDAFQQSGTRCFTIVREPVSRFWSAFNNRIVDNPQSGLGSRIAAFMGKNDSFIPEITPEMALDYTEQTPTHLVDEHLRPQWACCGYGKIRFDYIAKTESLNEDLEQIASLGMMPREVIQHIGRVNASKARTNEDTRKALEKRITQLYQKDFEIFGY